MERALPNALARAVALVVRVIPVMIQRHTDIRDPFPARSPKRPGWRILVLDDATARQRPCA